MSLTENACVKTGFWIGHSILVAPFARFPAVILVAIVVLIGSGCNLQRHRGNTGFNPKIPADIGAPAAEVVPGETEVSPKPVEPGRVAANAPELPAELGEDTVSTGVIVEKPREAPEDQGESPGALSTADILADGQNDASAGTVGRGAVFASLITNPGSLLLASAESSGGKVGILDPAFSETKGPSSALPESPSGGPVSGADAVAESGGGNELLISQEDPVKSQDDPAKKPPDDKKDQGEAPPNTEESSEETGTGDPPVADPGEEAGDTGEGSEKPAELPMGLLAILGACLALAVFKNTVGR